MKSSPTYHPCMVHLPIYIWLILVHVGKYTIHGLFGSKSLPSRCHLKSYSRWCFSCWCTPNSFPSRGFPRKVPASWISLVVGQELGRCWHHPNQPAIVTGEAGNTPKDLKSFLPQRTPSAHKKMKVFYTPKIWVITPKNEGCGFPW